MMDFGTYIQFEIADKLVIILWLYVAKDEQRIVFDDAALGKQC